MRSIELINSVLAKKSDDTETKQTDELKKAIDKLDNISATMEGIFNKLSAPTETPKKTKAKKTEVEETEGEEYGKPE